MPRLNEWLDSVMKVQGQFLKGKGKDKNKGTDKGKDKDKNKGKGKGGKKGKEKERLVAAGMVNRVPDFVIHMIELQDAIIEAQAALLVVLCRTGSLGVISQEQISGIGWLAAKKACGIQRPALVFRSSSEERLAPRRHFIYVRGRPAPQTPSHFFPK